MTTLVAIDESGDPGFGKGSSEHLIISFVFCSMDNINDIRKNMQKSHRTLVKREFWPSAIPELKFSPNTKFLRSLGRIGQRTMQGLEVTRENILSDISSDASVKACISHTVKKQVYNRLRSNPDLVYNYALAQPFITKFIKYFPYENDFKILLDKRMKPTSADHLNSYIKDKYNFYGRACKSITLEQVDSIKEPLIWVADFVGGAVYHKETFNDGRFYEKIRSKIVEKYKFWR
jgi:hypothetical protein